MKKEFIPYEQALVLKELGFDEPCLYCYFPNPNYKMGEKFDLIETIRMLPNQIKSIGELIKDGSFENTVLAPLYQQTFRFFRENHNLTSEVSIEQYRRKTDKKWMFSITYLNEDAMYEHSKTTFETYEEAELECLKKLIKLIKNK